MVRDDARDSDVEDGSHTVEGPERLKAKEEVVQSQNTVWYACQMPTWDVAVDDNFLIPDIRNGRRRSASNSNGTAEPGSRSRSAECCEHEACLTSGSSIYDYSAVRGTR